MGGWVGVRAVVATMSDDEGEVPTYEYAGDTKVLMDLSEIPHGYGKAKYPNKDRYKGWFVDGKRDGPGEYKFKAGGKFVGTYSQGIKVGQGVQTFPDGSKYEGPFVNDKFNGVGKYTYANGDFYEGEWVDGKRDGNGNYFVKASKATYFGEWSEGVFVAGDCTFADASTYEGTFNAKGPKGTGIYTFQPRNRLCETFVVTGAQGVEGFTNAVIQADVF